MIFPYVDVLRAGRLHQLPIVPIRVYGPHSHVNVLALVDSGAEHSVLPLRLVEELELPVDGATVVTIIGVGGKESRGYLLDANLRLARYQWTAPVIFSTAVESPAILGQAGFFAFFSVTFRYRNRIMDIRRERS